MDSSEKAIEFYNYNSTPNLYFSDFSLGSHQINYPIEEFEFNNNYKTNIAYFFTEIEEINAKPAPPSISDIFQSSLFSIQKNSDNKDEIMDKPNNPFSTKFSSNTIFKPKFGIQNEFYSKLSEQNQQILKKKKELEELIQKSEKESENLNKKKNNNFLSRKINEKPFIFKTFNSKFEKSGNNIKKKSNRNQNIQNKILRNLIQDIIPNWVNINKKKECKILNKISKKKLTYDINKYKEKKLYTIYSKNIFDDNNIINNENNLNNDTLLKLNFYFEEAIQAFCFEESRDDILLKVKKREFNLFNEKNNDNPNSKEFFANFKCKKKYINEKTNNKKEKIRLNKCFEEFQNKFNV